VLDAGIEVPHGGKDIYPSEDRLNGTFLELATNFNAVKAKIGSNSKPGASAAKSDDEEE
jgi:hypothetical protein